MVTLAGEIVARAGSLLLSVTVTPPAGAGVGSVIWNATDCPTATERPDGSPMTPELTTVTFRAPFVTFAAVVLEDMVADPPPRPVIATFTVRKP
jgi:hypothetical protein